LPLDIYHRSPPPAVRLPIWVSRENLTINVEVFRCSAASGRTGRKRVAPGISQKWELRLLHVISGFFRTATPRSSSGNAY
jgi:hypothetical protein